MRTQIVEPQPPSDDKRWRVVNGTMRRQGFAPDALIEALHTAQEAFGYLDDDVLRFVATGLRLPLSKVYGVATFYHHFTLKPQGRHNCVVCMGTACYIKGAGKLIEAAAQTAHIAPGETTPQGEVSLLTARCIGSCSVAPVVVYDGHVVANASPEQVGKQLGEWLNNEN